MNKSVDNSIVNEIKKVIFSARENASKAVHKELLTAYERLLSYEGNVNKEKDLALARERIEYLKTGDILKDPYVLEFLGIQEDKPMIEKDLGKALITKIKKFLLELGRGFMFVGSQQRITLGNVHYYVDMVFYNKVLKAYVLIDLKMGSLKPENIGQMNMYLNYYAREVNDDGDGKPIGIILCADASEIVAEYALGGLENQNFASKYVYYIPNKDELIRQVKDVIEESRWLKGVRIDVGREEIGRLC